MQSRKADRQLAAVAEPLHKRLHRNHYGPTGSGEPDGLDRWCEQVADGDRDRFESYLRSRDISTDECRRVLRFEMWPCDEPLPDWIGTWHELLEVVESNNSISKNKTGGEPEIPFGDVFVPLVEWAHAQLPTGPHSWSTDRGSKRRLTRRLSTIGASLLQVEFAEHLAERRPAYLTSESRRTEEAIHSSEEYRRFVSNLLDGELRRIGTEYPVFARLVSLTVQQFLTERRRLSERLDADRDRLADAFGITRCASVTSIVTGLGDAHAGGATVAAVQFSDGTDLIYKPRSVAPERALSEVTDAVNSVTEDDLMSLTVVERDDYGWVEHVEPSELTQGAESQYYRRVGTLVATLFLLSATDCHLENLFATEAGPVLIDAETIASQEAPIHWIPSEQSNRQTYQRYVRGSVLDTMLLPFSVNEVESSPDLSGIGGTKGDQWTAPKRKWEHINTDGMRLRTEKPTVSPANNHPTRDDERIPPGEYLSDIRNGFRQVCRAVLSSPSLRERIGAAIDAVPTRFILRPTEVYDAAIRSSFSPSVLESGVSHGLLMERLATSQYPVAETGEPLASLFESELDALSRLDVPRFIVATDSREIETAAGPVAADVFETTATAEIQRRLNELDHETVQRQLSLIDVCLESNTGGSADA
ncbi:MAG: type 2 lanthipeptide synthetase LanM [Halobaculum sp.]